MKALLILLVLLLAVPALAVPVDANNPYGIMAIDGWYVLCRDGSVHLLIVDHVNQEFLGVHFQTPGPATGPVPVPTEEIRDWNIRTLQTHSGDVYLYDQNNQIWQNITPGTQAGMPTCDGPIPDQKSTFGGVKGQYR